MKNVPDAHSTLSADLLRMASVRNILVSSCYAKWDGTLPDSYGSGFGIWR
jgi:hypothetical protein